MQARREKPLCNLVHVGQNLTVNRSCVTGSVISTSSSCQRLFVSPLSRGPASQSPVVIPQSSPQPRVLLQLPQYISCSQPPPKPQQQSQDQQASGRPFEKIFMKASISRVHSHHLNPSSSRKIGRPVVDLLRRSL